MQLFRHPLLERVKVSLWILCSSVVFSSLAYSESVQPPAGMLRFPAISQEHVAFSYATQLWIAPREGGMAKPVAFPAGTALWPSFSPDGRQLAFVANYDGQRDIHVIPTEGGIPRRLTTHPGSKQIHGWTRDGSRIVYSTNFFAGINRTTELFSVSVKGGLPEKLPVPYGVNASFSPDGTRMAYMTHTRDFRTWKRYRGGLATDIWIFGLEDHTSRRITEWEGTDTFPMWHGDSIYYLSDELEPYRLNIWRYHVPTGRRERITEFAEYDVKFPSLGPGPRGRGEIVFQLGQKLKVLDLGNRRVRELEIRIPGALPILRPQLMDASKTIQSRAISPSGARVLLEARGDLWTLPARRGSARNLTRTSGVAEREPSWSPDGKWILYSSDVTGEYQLHLRPADGTGSSRQLTAGHVTYWYTPVWAPDSKRFVVFDKANRLFYGEIPDEDVEPSTLRELDYEPNWPWTNLSWSPDSRWVVYSKTEQNERRPLSTRALWVVNVTSGERQRLTSGMFSAANPVFDPKGEYLFFTMNSEFSSPQYEDLGTTFVYHNTGRLMVASLREDVPSPFLPKSDEETGPVQRQRPARPTNNNSSNGEPKDENEEPEPDKDNDENGEPEPDQEDNKGGETEETPSLPENDDPDNDRDEDSTGETVTEVETSPSKAGKPEKKKEEGMRFDWDGFENRIVAVPLPRGNFRGLAISDKRHLVYLRANSNRGNTPGTLHIYNPFHDDPKEETIVGDINSFIVSADGKKVLALRRQTMAVLNTAPNQRWENPVNTSTMQQRVHPREEWTQILRDAWRRQRDFFYVENLHGVDWDRVWEDYSALLPYLSSRGDLQYVIGEMIGELNAGHAYISGGDFGDEPTLAIGRLGADFSWEESDGVFGFRIARIFRGGPWDTDARGPLNQPGLQVKEGDFLIAINGLPLSSDLDPWAALAGLANQTVTLTLAESPAAEESEQRRVVVRTVNNDQDLRYRHWVEANRRHVEERSGGRIGYIHVPDTGVNGQNELFRQYFGQHGRDALLIDIRWNGGGQIPHRFVELLNRPHLSYWARRDAMDWATPADGHSGPKAMLINGHAGSGGDALPYYFRKAGLGKLIGTRTWGGLIGMTTVPLLIDGALTNAPTFGIYNREGRWTIEGHGVDPDIEVIDDPALMINGGDPQLEAAIDHLLAELERAPYQPPARPADPDRSGFGIDPAHR